MAFEHATGGQQLQSIFYNLQQYGFLDFLLPALLIFVVIFGVLQRIDFFQTPKMIPKKDAAGKTIGYEKAPPDEHKNVPKVPDKKINGLIAAILAVSIVVPHTVGLYPVNIDPILLIYKLLPNTGVLLVAIMAIILILGISGAGIPSSFHMLIGIIAAIILVIIFMVNIFPSFFPWFSFLSNPSAYGPLIVIGVVVLVIYFAFREGGGEPAHLKIRTWMRKP